MNLGVILGVMCAILLHAGFILFGGALFSAHDNEHGSTHDVELLSEDDPAEDEPEDPALDDQDELDDEPEPAPDAKELVRSLSEPPTPDAPALEAASLSAIEAALNGQGAGAGDFASSLSFASGGRIGGTGQPGAADQTLDNAFSLAEIDQKPRAVFQTSPVYPPSMRGKNIEAVVTVIFVVDQQGKVDKPRVEKSTNAAFDKPVLDAVKKWKFEPGVKGGKRVACKMRVPIRFPAS